MIVYYHKPTRVTRSSHLLANSNFVNMNAVKLQEGNPLDFMGLPGRSIQL